MSHRGKCTFVVNFFFLFVSDSELRPFKFKMTESTSDDASAIIAPVASLCSRFYSEHENRGRHRTGTETQKRLMSQTRCADERKFVWFAGKNSDTTDQHQRGRRKKKATKFVTSSALWFQKGRKRQLLFLTPCCGGG